MEATKALDMVIKNNPDKKEIVIDKKTYMELCEANGMKHVDEYRGYKLIVWP